MRIHFAAKGCIPGEEVARNRAYAKGLGLPPVRAGASSLAVVGAGPSLVDHVDELRQWEGDVWALNDVWRWCEARGIDAKMFSIDPLPAMSEIGRGVKKSVLATVCPPVLFDVLADAEVEIFDMGAPGTMSNGPTSAATAPLVAVLAGYRDVTLFGCDSSFTGKSHVHKSYEYGTLQVECGGEVFTTFPEWLMQAETISAFVREFPDVIHVRGGGLLPKMVEYPDWDCISMSKKAFDDLEWGEKHETLPEWVIC